MTLGSEACRANGPAAVGMGKREKGPFGGARDRETDHLVHLGDLVSEMVINCSRTGHVEHLGGLGCEMVRIDTPTRILNFRLVSTTPSEFRQPEMI